MLPVLLQLIDTEEEKNKFEALYLKYQWLMFAVAKDILKDHHLAEDAVNDAFIKIINNFEKIGDIECPRTESFVVIVIRNVCFNMIKKSKRQNVILIEDYRVVDKKSYGDVSTELLDRYDKEQLVKALKELPDILRDALMLYSYYEMTTEKVAELVGVTRETVKKRIQRARKQLKTILEGRNEQ